MSLLVIFTSPTLGKVEEQLSQQCARMSARRSAWQVDEAADDDDHTQQEGDDNRARGVEAGPG
jgi:hypothetical protein